MTRFTWAVLWVGWLLTASAAPSLAADPKAEAERILETAGVKGGLIVHLGCGDGQLTAALRANDSYLVHGLTTDAKVLDRARDYIHSQGQYGKVSVDRWDGKHLPYVDNLVNLLVIEEPGKVSKEEIQRILVPDGIALSKQDGKWTKTTKPRPRTIDDWTHYLYDSKNNPVSRDTAIGPPRHLQWLAGPRYSRHHDHMSAASAMVSARGRVFYIFDHGPHLAIQLPSRWLLVARDAFNGTPLWQREISHWHTQMFRLKSGPSQLTRRLVTDGDRVYVTLGLEAPVCALDAATGKTLKTYEKTKGTEEILYSKGTLFLSVNDKPFRQPLDPRNLNYRYQEGERRTVAIDAESGKVLWDKKQKDVMPCTLCLDDKRVLFHNGERVLCLDRKDGKKLWESKPLTRRKTIPTFYAPTLVLHDDVVLFSGGTVEGNERGPGGGVDTMVAMQISDGKPLWTAEHPASGYKSPEDLMVIDGLVWVGSFTLGKDSGELTGRDLHTGKVKQQFEPDVKTHWFHHRCYRAKATDSYLLTSRTGIEFVDLKKEHWECNHWVRGACLYGTMPANGMIYNPPHPCACYLEAKMYGFNALAPATASRQVPDKIPLEGRLEKGPAYDRKAENGTKAGDWPTYRGDPARSGSTTVAVPTDLKKAWELELGGRLSPVTVANDRLFVSSIDTHTLHVLDSTRGLPLWKYIAGGRIDSPPTVWKGRVLFGSADGYIYCLWAKDGELAWRFRAAPLDRRMGCFDQIESAWPVHGSVLIKGEELWAVAGRSMFLDGGLRLVRLNPSSGKLIAEEVMDDRDPASGENLQVLLKTLNMPVALNDVLSFDGKYVYMRSQRFNAKGKREELEVPTLNVAAQKGDSAHLFCPTGFLDDVWWHRSYWVFGRVWKSGAGGYFQSGRVAPAGRPLVFNDTTVFGYGRKPQYYRWTTPMEYQLFATAKSPEVVKMGGKGARAKKGGAGAQPPKRFATNWTADVPMFARGLVLADKTLFVVGPPDLINEVETLGSFAQKETQKLLARQAVAYEGKEGCVLWAVSTKDGSKIAQGALPSAPVHDGLVAANGRLFMTTLDGRVLSLGKKK